MEIDAYKSNKNVKSKFHTVPNNPVDICNLLRKDPENNIVKNAIEDALKSTLLVYRSYEDGMWYDETPRWDRQWDRYAPDPPQPY